MNRTQWTAALSAGLLSLVTAARADLLNGSFDSGLTGWSVDGSVQAVISPTGNRAAVLDEQAPTARSRIYQAFTIQDDPGKLVFLYKLVTGVGARPADLPPDSFTAFLLDANGARLAIPGGNDPTFTSGFLYADSDGHLVYDTDHVNVQMTPGPDGMYGVTLKELNSNGLIGQTLRLEFDLATADNGVTSAVFMDGITDGSPATPYSGVVTAGVGLDGGPDSFTINVPSAVFTDSVSRRFVTFL